MIDIGVNLLSEQYDQDRDAVIERARAAELAALIVTASTVAESQAVQNYCAKHPGYLYCTAGVHPHHADAVAALASDSWVAALGQLSSHPSVVAMGEMGLDYNRDFARRENQRRVLGAQLELARSLRMPIFAHERDAADDMVALLESQNVDPSRVVIHCFTGDHNTLARYLEMGCMIGVTGWVCDRKRGQRLRELMPLVPLERLLIETDGPYLKPHNAPKQPFPQVTPTPARRRNEPALLGYVVAEIARVRNQCPGEIKSATQANAVRFFEKLALASSATATSVALQQQGQ